MKEGENNEGKLKGVWGETSGRGRGKRRGKTRNGEGKERK